MKTPNYHDFYQMALVPIGVRDRIALNETGEYSQDTSFTHWLIAVEGVQLSQKKIYFHWKVTIYPSTSEEDFNWKKPYYCSCNMEIMDWAISHASTLITACTKDLLASSTKLEKIS